MSTALDTGVDTARFQEAVQGIYRLFKVATFHELDNDAVSRAIDLSLTSLTRFGGGREGLSMLFARDTVIVNGRLLQAPPEIYDLAMEFGGFLLGVGINSIGIDLEADTDDLRALLRFFRERLHSAREKAAAEAHGDEFEVDESSFTVQPDRRGAISPHVRLRAIKEHLLLGLEDPRLSVLERVMLTYALAIRVVRQLETQAMTGTATVPAFFKRVSRQLALADYGSRPMLLDVMLAPADAGDRARRAANAAIVAAAMVARLGASENVRSAVTFAAMLLDLGTLPDGRGADGIDDVALASARTQIRSGDLRGETLARTLATFEAIRLRQGVAPEQVYFGAHDPAMIAHVLLLARVFVDALAREQLSRTPAAFDAASRAAATFAHGDDGLAVLALLHDAIGLVPAGALVRLADGHIAIVRRAGSRPTVFARPLVRIIADGEGRPMAPVDVDLSVPGVREKLGAVEEILNDPEFRAAAGLGPLWPRAGSAFAASRAAGEEGAAGAENRPEETGVAAPASVHEDPTVAALAGESASVHEHPTVHAAPAPAPPAGGDMGDQPTVPIQRPGYPAPRPAGTPAPRAQAPERAAAVADTVPVETPRAQVPAARPIAPPAADFTRDPSSIRRRAADAPRGEFAHEAPSARQVATAQWTAAGAPPAERPMTGAEALRAALRPELPPERPPGSPATARVQRPMPESTGEHRSVSVPRPQPAPTGRPETPSGSRRVVARDVVNVRSIRVTPGAVPSVRPPPSAEPTGSFRAVEEGAAPPPRATRMATSELDALVMDYLRYGEPDDDVTPVPGGDPTSGD